MQSKTAENVNDDDEASRNFLRMLHCWSLVFLSVIVLLTDFSRYVSSSEHARACPVQASLRHCYTSYYVLHEWISVYSCV